MKKTSSSSLKLIFAVISLLSFIPAYSATIKGHVKDAKNNDLLIGATVYLKENNQINDAAGLDGSYSLKNVQPGTYTMVVQIFSYITQERSVTVTGASDVMVQDFSLMADSLMMKEIQIVGSYDKESDTYARGLEKNSDYEINILSAKTMQLLPDITVGNVLQRVSGVVIQKSVTGGGKYATIRGMQQRYNYSTVNGVKIPSPDYNNNYVPLDMFPSEILERLEVVKTLRPDMYGDGIGGATNLVLKSSPDYFTLTANVATGYNQNVFNNTFNGVNASGINKQSPEQINGSNYAASPSNFPTSPFLYSSAKPSPDILGGFTIGDRFLNNKLGVLLSSSYQNTNSITKAFFILPDAEAGTNSGPNTPIFDDIESRTYSLQEQREAAHLKLDYDVNSKNRISFYAVYVGLNQFRSDFKSDTGIFPATLKKDYETKVTYENIFNSTLQGQDSLAQNLLFDWSGSYARGYSNTPDWGNLTTNNGNTVAPNYQFYYNGWDARWWQNTDQTYTGSVNLTYKLSIAQQNVVLKVGAMNEDKNRVDYYEDYSMNATVANAYLVSSTPLSDNLWSLSDPFGTPTDANNYTIIQDITAVYGMAQFNIGPKISVMGGLRGENTVQDYGTALPISEAAQYGNIHYIDYLPSGEISFAITNKQSIRASYFSSISRPNFSDLIPYQITTDYYTEIGNPELLHTQAQNYDLQYRFFPDPTGELLAGVFYKNLIDPIEQTFLRYKTSSYYLEPSNDTNKAYVYGFELVVSKKFLKDFEVRANYTYSHSQTTVGDLYYFTNAAGGLTNEVLNETRPLQGQADNIGNLSLLYDNEKIGLHLNLSGVYTGKLIATVSPLYGLDLWQLPQYRVDFSFEQRLSKKIKISIYGKINNILNTALKIVEYPPSPYYNNPANVQSYLPNQSGSGYLNTILQEQETYGQYYIIGFRYKF